ncbi:TPR repeat protein [Beijerinckia sp. GAS462]|nr:TPR repeat protein [Beijerinckia sp. GAS462]SEC63270.1 TPR repeat [Beijerinckia sp. 28-YEA-48]
MTALRTGTGTQKQPEAARALLEKAANDDAFARLQLARMLVNGEGGPRDLARGLALLDDKSLQNMADRPRIMADLFLNNEIVGRDPRRAIAAFQSTRLGIDDSIRLAGLLTDYQAKVDKAALVQRLSLAATVGEPGAGMALAKLKLSRNTDFRDEAGARDILALMTRDGDPATQVLLARAHFSNLDSTSLTALAPGPLHEAQIRKIIADGVAAGQADALLLQGQLTRKGVLYPQDDEAATRLIVKAAELGNVEAMLAAGRAYADGLGIAKNPRERLRFWRKAAEQGSIEAKENLASAFTFDFGARLMTLSEGISYPVALYGDGAGRRYGDQSNFGGFSLANTQISTLFAGGRITDFPRKAIAAAVIDGLQMAPAGTTEDKLVALSKAMPQDVRAEIEKVLKAEGKFAGEPNGYFGPDARTGLRMQIEARGPWRQAAVQAAVPTANPTATQPNAPPQPQISRAVVDSVREKALQRSQTIKTDADRLAALRMFNALARLGDLHARWLMMSNYHQSSLVRQVVSPEELTRYSLDILVVKPDEAPKASFEFIFDLTTLYKQDRGKTFGPAFLAAVRDDPRLQDLSMLTEISKHMMFAPGACDAVLAAAKLQKIGGLDGEGCSEPSLDAIVAYAKKAGPANVESKARAQAAIDVTKLAQ